MVNQLRYSREELFSLKNVKPSTHTRLPDPLYHCFLENSIACKPHGCQGGDSDRTKHARVVVSNRHSNDKQAFNYNGRFRAPTLIHIPVTTDCVACEHSKFALKLPQKLITPPACILLFMVQSNIKLLLRARVRRDQAKAYITVEKLTVRLAIAERRCVQNGSKTA